MESSFDITGINFFYRHRLRRFQRHIYTTLFYSHLWWCVMVEASRQVGGVDRVVIEVKMVVFGWGWGWVVKNIMDRKSKIGCKNRFLTWLFVNIILSSFLPYLCKIFFFCPIFVIILDSWYQNILLVWGFHICWQFHAYESNEHIYKAWGFNIIIQLLVARTLHTSIYTKLSSRY